MGSDVTDGYGATGDGDCSDNQSDGQMVATSWCDNKINNNTGVMVRFLLLL